MKKYKYINYTCLLILNIIKKYNFQYKLLAQTGKIYDTIFICSELDDKMNDIDNIDDFMLYNNRNIHIKIYTNPLMTYENICIILINDMKYYFYDPEKFQYEIENFFFT